MSYDAWLIDKGHCPELIWRDTEDGPVDGRCMAPIVTVTVPPDPRYGEQEPEVVAFACAAHTEERLQWRVMSEQEHAAWERNQEEYA